MENGRGRQRQYIPKPNGGGVGELSWGKELFYKVGKQLVKLVSVIPIYCSSSSSYWSGLSSLLVGMCVYVPNDYVMNLLLKFLIS